MVQRATCLFGRRLRKDAIFLGIFVFTALHGMQTRSSDETSVCPSVCQTRGINETDSEICQCFDCSG